MEQAGTVGEQGGQLHAWGFEQRLKGRNPINQRRHVRPILHNKPGRGSPRAIATACLMRDSHARLSYGRTTAGYTVSCCCCCSSSSAFFLSTLNTSSSEDGRRSVSFRVGAIQLLLVSTQPQDCRQVGCKNCAKRRRGRASHPHGSAQRRCSESVMNATVPASELGMIGGPQHSSCLNGGGGSAARSAAPAHDIWHHCISSC